MNPFFFGESDNLMFGAYHAPRLPADPASAVLVCPAVGADHDRSSATVNSMCQALADAGHHVLNFDYPATGNSTGDISQGQLIRWLRGIDAATREILQLSGATRLNVVGIRLGGLLACTAFATRSLVPYRLVLVDPVVSGTTYLRLVRNQRRKFSGLLGRFPLRTWHLWAFGYPPDLVQSLCFLDLRQDWQAVALQNSALVHTGRSEDSMLLKDYLQQRGLRLQVAVAGPEFQWDRQTRRKADGAPTLPIGPIVAMVGGS